MRRVHGSTHRTVPSAQTVRSIFAHFSACAHTSFLFSMQINSGYFLHTYWSFHISSSLLLYKMINSYLWVNCELHMKHFLTHWNTEDRLSLKPQTLTHFQKMLLLLPYRLLHSDEVFLLVSNGIRTLFFMHFSTASLFMKETHSFIKRNKTPRFQIIWRVIGQHPGLLVNPSTRDVSGSFVFVFSPISSYLRGY